MFIARKPPYEWSTGELLNPEGINENNNYFKQVLEQTANEQTCRWTNTFSLVPSVTTPITSSTSFAHTTRNIPTSILRTINVTSSVTVEGVYIVAYYTSSFAWTMNISGTTSETITFPARTTAENAVDAFRNVTLLNLTNTSGDLISCSLPSTVNISKLDVTVAYASDKYVCGDFTSSLNKPTLSYADFDTNTDLSASAFNTLSSSLINAANAAIKGQPCRWVAVDFFDINDTTSLRERAKPIPTYQDPSFTNVTSSARVVGFYIDGVCTGIESGDSVTYGWMSNGGSYITGFNNILSLPVGAGPTAFRGGFLVPTGSIYTNTINTKNLDRYVALTVSNSGGVTIPTIQRATVYMLLQ